MITGIGFEAFSEVPRAKENFAIMGTDAKFSCSACHNQHLQKSEPWTSTGPYVAYDPDNPTKASSNNRKFLRIDNDRSQLCLECHSSRAHAPATNTRGEWDGTKKSHPIGKIFATKADADPARALAPDVTNVSPFNSAPLKPDGTVQTGTDKRYGATGADGNVTNNLILDPDGRIACLTCHGMHYTDSNAATVDKP